MWFEEYDTSRIISHRGCIAVSQYLFNGYAINAHTATQCGSTGAVYVDIDIGIKLTFN